MRWNARCRIDLQDTMIRKSITTGIIVGLLLTLAALYPVFVILVSRVLPGAWFAHVLDLYPLTSIQKVLPLLALMACAAAGTFVYLGLGSLAALRSGARAPAQGAVAGMISGVAAALTLHIALVSPTLGVVAGYDLFAAPVTADASQLTDPMIVEFAQRLLERNMDYLLALSVIGLLAGGMEGAVVGWFRRRKPSAPRPVSLLQALETKQGQRRWFAPADDQVDRMGVSVGVVGGLVIAFAYFWSLSTTTGGAHEVWMYDIFRQATAGQSWNTFANPALAAWLTPLAFLVLIGMGGVAAFLPRNPPTRLGARVSAAMIAGTLSGIMIVLPLLDALMFNLGVLPRLMAASPASGEPLSPAERAVGMTLASVPARVLLMYLLPVPMTAAFMAALTLWGAVQGVFYGMILTLLKLRPVDRANTVRQDIVAHDDQFLLRLYRLFQADPQAALVLEHLAFELKADPDKARDDAARDDAARDDAARDDAARIVAAYHALATASAQSAEALETVALVLDGHADWKLGKQVAALHRLLAQGLRAVTVPQIAALAPLPEEQTTPLPPQLGKLGGHLSRSLDELKKVERVDDLNTKIIFLNNTLEALRLAQIFCTDGAAGGNACGALLPEFCAARALLDQWEAVVIQAVKELQGRAELVATLKTRRLTFASRLALTVALSNQGLNVAEDIHFLADDTDDYAVVEGGRQSMDILPPQASRAVTFTLAPRQPMRQLRVNWKITYDDAFNNDRPIEFGDQLEFAEADKPFQRIFPIPYVTGTPLQSSEMFVGRQDVFDFVREHLLGAYQNNVIVLHGQRRSGKTSILYLLNEVLADTHVCVLIDMQGKAARGEVDFLYSVADDIAYALENKGLIVELPLRQAFVESPEFFFRSRFLRGVAEALGSRNLLIMFDEFEELQKRVQDGKLTADIFPYLRNLMQHERKVDFVFAGTHKLEELAAEYWSILFNIAAYKKITFLSADEVERLVKLPVAPCGLEYDPLAVKMIYQVAAGHPYFTQVLCHELVAYHNETQRNYLTTTEVDAALGRILERGEAHFKYIWAESSISQRLVLLALAELLEAGEAATMEDVSLVLHKHGCALDARELSEALDNLEARDILMRSGPRSSLYRFRVDLIRRWIYATRPAYDKVAHAH